jgi:hypothetical protein
MPRKREKVHDSCGNIKMCIADLKHYPYARYKRSIETMREFEMVVSKSTKLDSLPWNR